MSLTWLSFVHLVFDKHRAQRDGFGRGRRMFCIFVALSCQMTVTLAVLLLTIPSYAASLLSASISFVYEKPIVKLVKFTARQECCGSCCNCFSASLSYCFVVSCFIQIPAVLIFFYFWGYRQGNFLVTFGFTQLMSAWAASVALGYVTAVGSIALRFCCCPAKYTKEMNEYVGTIVITAFVCLVTRIDLFSPLCLSGLPLCCFAAV